MKALRTRGDAWLVKGGEVLGPFEPLGVDDSGDGLRWLLATAHPSIDRWQPDSEVYFYWKSAHDEAESQRACLVRDSHQFNKHVEV